MTNINIEKLVDAENDGIIANVLDVNGTGAQAVAIVDGNGDPITSFGGGTQYTDGAVTPASPIGTIPVFDDGGVITAVSDTNPLPVLASISTAGLATDSNQTSGAQKTQIVNGAGAVIGATSNALDVNIKSGSVTANAGTNLNTSALALEAGGNLAGIRTAVELIDNAIVAEDTAAASGFTGIPVFATRRDTDDSEVTTDGDYEALHTNQFGRLKVSIQPAAIVATTGSITASGQSVAVDTNRTANVTMTISGTFATFNGTFEASIDGGSTYFAIQAARTNANTTELTTGSLSAAPVYAWRMATGGYTNVRIRATALGSGTVAVRFVPGAFATENQPVIPTHPVTQSGTWNVGTVTTLTTLTGTTTLTPGTGAANLGKAEDAAHASGDTGVAVWGVRNDNLATTYGADQDYGPIATDLKGRVMVAQKAATGTLSNVAGSATSVTLLAANANRIGATITNDSSALLYIKLGATASTSSYTVVLAGAASAPFSYYEVPAGYTGIIDGIWASAAGNARVTEIT